LSNADLACALLFVRDHGFCWAFLLLWGIGCFSTNSAQQARLVMLSPPHAPVSVAMNSSAMYLGQAVGTAAGAAVLAGVAGPFAYSALALISIPLFIISIAVSSVIKKPPLREKNRGAYSARFAGWIQIRAFNVTRHHHVSLAFSVRFAQQRRPAAHQNIRSAPSSAGSWSI
jgi:hypothetical protein